MGILQSSSDRTARRQRILRKPLSGLFWPKRPALVISIWISMLVWAGAVWYSFWSSASTHRSPHRLVRPKSWNASEFFRSTTGLTTKGARKRNSPKNRPSNLYEVRLLASEARSRRSPSGCVAAHPCLARLATHDRGHPARRRRRRLTHPRRRRQGPILSYNHRSWRCGHPREEVARRPMTTSAGIFASEEGEGLGRSRTGQSSLHKPPTKCGSNDTVLMKDGRVFNRAPVPIVSGSRNPRARPGTSATSTESVPQRDHAGRPLRSPRFSREARNLDEFYGAIHES